MMNQNETNYLNSLRFVRQHGNPVLDRTQVGTRKYFGMMNRYDLQENFPLLTTKKLDLKSVSSELIWFLEGSGDERRLAELRYGKSRVEITDKKTIWTANAEAPYWVEKAERPGDLGRVYGVQWRGFRAAHTNEDGAMSLVEIDQIDRLVHGLKTDPYGRRHILTAWNPGELDQMALPPCHVLSQFSVENNRLSSILYQRSCDKFLGEPYNIASYALLTHMIAQVCGYEVGEFIHMQADAHIYENHLEQVDEQLLREPVQGAKLLIDRSVTRIEDFTVDSFSLEGYHPAPTIKAPMAV